MKKHIRFLAALVLISLLAITCKEENDEIPYGSIAGVVTDKATGEPIKSAGVSVGTISVVTGTDGYYEFHNIDKGSYRIQVQKTGYDVFSSKGEIIVNGGETTQYDIQMQKLPPSLRVVDGNTNEDISSMDLGLELSSASFNIFNDGPETLEWQITIDDEWVVSVSKKEGSLKAGATQAIVMNIDRLLLKKGGNTTTIHVTSDNGSKNIVLTAANDYELPTLNTLEAQDVTTTTAVVNGKLLTNGNPKYKERGFVYSLSSMPTVDNTIAKITVAITDESDYSALVTGLEKDKTYYVRAYAINDIGTAYSTNEIKFVTNGSIPKVKTDAYTDKVLSTASVSLHGQILFEGDPKYSERGFVYGFAHNPNIEDDTKKIVLGSGVGEYTVSVTELKYNKIYYIRAYAKNEVGTAYGDEVELDMASSAPEVSTDEVSNKVLSTKSITLNGTILTAGDPAYSEKGFVYGLTHNPEVGVSDKKVVSGSSVGKYTTSISDLELNRTYYVRAYVINASGIVYGNEVEFDMIPTTPEVSTDEVTNKVLSTKSITLNGTILAAGDPAYTEKGFVYGLTHNPEVGANNKKEVTGSGVGKYSMSIANLELDKTYYVRAYVINEVGIIYGNEVEFDMASVLPRVTTNSITGKSITATSAILNGTIEEEGNPKYTERGFVYGLLHNPTKGDAISVKVDGSGLGQFSVKISELTVNTIYYVRAYASNESGIVYGEEVVLDMTSISPVVNSVRISNKSVETRSATVHGSIEEEGDPKYIERGFVYGLVHNPNVTDDLKKIAIGTGIGAFTMNLTDLEVNKTYFVRAYATNEYETVYGSELELDMTPTKPVVTTKECTAKSISTASATLNGSIEEEGDPRYIERGFVYGLVHNPNIEDSEKKIATGVGLGNFFVSISDLSINKTYYVRAYAKTDYSIVYGEEVELDMSTVLPAISTSEVILPTGESTVFTFNAKIEKEGDPSFVESGFVYGPMQLPTLDNGASVVKCSMLSPAQVEVSGLELGEIYYVRFYVKTSDGTYYANVLQLDAQHNDYYVLKSANIMIMKHYLTSGMGYDSDWKTANTACESSVLGGFSDWRLPTYNELALIYTNREKINLSSPGSKYWSSYYGSGTYYYLDFFTGSYSSSRTIEHVLAIAVRIITNK